MLYKDIQDLSPKLDAIDFIDQARSISYMPLVCACDDLLVT